MKLAKKWYFKAKIKEKKHQLWDREFTKKFLGEQREGLRIEYDRINEKLDGMKRRVCDELYELIYSDSDASVEIRTAPLSPDEINTLKHKKTKESRYHTVLKQDPDKTILESFAKEIEQIEPDVKQLKDQMQQLTERIEGPLIDPSDPSGTDQSLNGSSEDLRTLINLLTNHLKSL